MREFRISVFGPGDSVEVLTELLHRAYKGLGDRGMNYTAVDQAVQTTRERIEGRTCLLATVGGRLVGTLNLHLDGKHELRPGAAYISQFGVEPEMQGSGIGGNLLDHAEYMARESGFAEVAMDTALDADELMRYYTRRGYVQLGTHQWPGKTYRSAILVKQLHAAP